MKDRYGNLAHLTPRLSLVEIKTAVAMHYNVRPESMESPRRSRKYVRPRQMAMYLARRLTARSLPEIGTSFGRRHHATVIWAIKSINLDPERRAEAEALEALLQGWGAIFGTNNGQMARTRQQALACEVVGRFFRSLRVVVVF